MGVAQHDPRSGSLQVLENSIVKHEYMHEEIFFPCDECGTMTADHMLASINTDTGMRNCCPMCYSECYEDPRGIPTEYTINYLEVIKHEVKVTAMSRAQAERITLSGNKDFALRTTRLPQTIGKSIVKETTDA